MEPIGVLFLAASAAIIKLYMPTTFCDGDLAFLLRRLFLAHGLMGKVFIFGLHKDVFSRSFFFSFSWDRQIGTGSAQASALGEGNAYTHHLYTSSS